jgi:histone deacetylase 11
VELAIYNAGTDVLAGDPLGGLRLSPGDILTRDQFVIQTLRDRNLPTVVLTSGGYTIASHQSIAQMILASATAF